MAGKTIAEQLVALKATREAHQNKLNEVAQKSIDEDRSMNTAEQEEFDTLEKDIGTIDSDVARLTRLEAMQAKGAVPAAAAFNADGGAVPFNGVAVKHAEKLEPGIGFARYAMLLGKAKGDHAKAFRLAETHYPQSENIVKLLKAQGFTEHGPITVMFNTDEERGSFGSRALIQKLASESDMVLSFEPTSAQQEMLTLGTAGIVYYRVAVKGAAAHAGAMPEIGVNALVEAADIVSRTHDLDDRARDLRFNWTIFQSGAVHNVVPDQARLQADIRYAREEDLKGLLAALEDRIQNQKKLQGSHITIAAERGRPAFTANAGGRQMVDKAIAIYREAGATLQLIPRTGGGTDAAYAALSGKPVIEGLGLPGFGIHSDQDEYVQIDAVPRRLYLVARMIMDLSQGL